MLCCLAEFFFSRDGTRINKVKTNVLFFRNYVFKSRGFIVNMDREMVTLQSENSKNYWRLRFNSRSFLSAIKVKYKCL